MRYTKRGKIRFTSHRDVARLFERSIRMAGIPIAYSEGFSPRPRFSFGLALPTTFASDAEFFDMILREPADPAPYPALMSAALPVGIDVEAAMVIEPGAESLQEAVTSSTWQLELLDTDTSAVQAWLESVEAADSIQVVQERKGKEVERDIRPAILGLQLTDQVEPTSGEDPVGLIADLANKPRALRPMELLEVFDPGFSLLRGRRKAQWILSDGVLVEPLGSPSLAQTAPQNAGVQ